MTLEVIYFAWVRERIGIPRETVETAARTVSELVDELIARDDRYAAALSDKGAYRVALDQELADFGDPIENAREIAFFPPMTGG
ncbi:MAG: molybdopterin converting factor subunit 1 [Paracoccus sp. (in: a-proteobacteria)]|nr:molybdopterin converting factor subunit 1 [Paracoccus sp. (in: a-proteobacteria)]